MTFSYMEDWDQRYVWVRAQLRRAFQLPDCQQLGSTAGSGSVASFLEQRRRSTPPGWLELWPSMREARRGRCRMALLSGWVGSTRWCVSWDWRSRSDPWSGLHPEAWTPTGPSYWTRYFLAVTAACLMVDHEKLTKSTASMSSLPGVEGTLTSVSGSSKTICGTS